MRKIKPLLDFYPYSPLIKVGFFRNIAGHMASNPVFFNSPVPMEEVNAAIDAFEAAILDAKDGSHTAKAIMREHELLLNTMFTTLNHFVNTVANGDEVIVRGSGFNVLKQPVPHSKSILELRYTDHSGTLLLVAAKIGKVIAFTWQVYMGVAPIAESDWVPLKTTAQSRYTLEGLIPGHYISVRVALISAAGISDFCAPVTILII